MAAPRDQGWLLRGNRRITHLQRITLRNLEPTKSKSPLSREELEQLSCYYSLHVPGRPSPLYVSSLDCGTVNPSWEYIRPEDYRWEPTREFSEVEVCVRRDTSMTLEKLRAREYAGKMVLEKAPEELQRDAVLLRRKVKLSELERVHPERADAQLPEFPPGTLCFYLNDGVYVERGVLEKLLASAAAEGTVPPSLQPEMREAFTVLPEPRSVGRRMPVRTTVDELVRNATEIFELELQRLAGDEHAKEVRKRFEAQLAKVTPKHTQISVMQARRERISDLEQRIEIEMDLLANARHRVRKARKGQVSPAEALAREGKSVQDVRTHLRDKVMQHAVKEEQLKLEQVERQFRTRQRKLVSHLIAIFPVERRGGQFNIRGLPLCTTAKQPNADEEVTATALGFVAQAVLLLAKYADVPLRFRIIYYGSRSSIRDDVSGSPEYPLYSKGTDSSRFRDACLLLNRNVTQLREAVGNTTAGALEVDPELLSNLQSLYQHFVPRRM